MDKSAPGTLFSKQPPVLGSLTSCYVSLFMLGGRLASSTWTVI